MSKILLMNARIFSHLNYGSSIFGKCSEKLQYEEQKCINFDAKVANNRKYVKADHVTPLLKDWHGFTSTASCSEMGLNVKNISFDLQNQVSQNN